MNLDDKNERLHRSAKEYWEFLLQQNPTFATYIGDHRYNDALEDLSEESLSAQIEFFKGLLTKINKIDQTSLSVEDRLNQRLLQHTLENHIQIYRYRSHYTPVDHLKGPHIDFPQIIEYHPFKNRGDVEKYLKRLHAFSRLMDQVIENLQKGIHHKITAFSKIIEYVTGQVETFTKLDPEDNPLMKPVLKLTNDFSKPVKEEIRNSVKKAISSSVTPAYKKLMHYLNEKYRRHCREREGIWSLPEGTDMYRFYVRYHTTTDLSPEEIHKIGLQEVETIQNEIRKIMKKIGFSGSVREFAEFIKGQKDLYPDRGKEILDRYRIILSTMDKRLPDFFGTFPKAKYDIREIEKYREQVAPAAYYYPPPEDFSRPGYFYVNTYKPERRPRFEMEALAFHEAVPGHHLQIALMQEQQGIPDFRRYEGSTAFIEGWALYAEKLSREMGFYEDDYSEYGRLSFELWRAVRLVVDTGIHSFRWSRNESIQYCREQTGLDDHEIEIEVDRYIALPGQALAYKIGELKILELRDKAKKTLGLHFNIKQFHDRVLEHGALPLNSLETVMDEWIDKVR